MPPVEEQQKLFQCLYHRLRNKAETGQRIQKMISYREKKNNMDHLPIEENILLMKKSTVIAINQLMIKMLKIKSIKDFDLNLFDK